jgi:hypothetical protein
MVVKNLPWPDQLGGKKDKNHPQNWLNIPYNCYLLLLISMAGLFFWYIDIIVMYKNVIRWWYMMSRAPTVQCLLLLCPWPLERGGRPGGPKKIQKNQSMLMFWYTGCPITHRIHCKKSAKTICQLKKRLGGKKKLNSISGDRWSELGPVKNWEKSLHKSLQILGHCFFWKVYYKKVHASKPDTPRLKSMIFSFKMRYFPAFYVVLTVSISLDQQLFLQGKSYFWPKFFIQPPETQ